jgi:hypothetical protein
MIRLGCIVLAGLLGWFGFVQYKAHVVFGMVHRSILDAPHVAMASNFEAYRIFPFAALFRAQLPVTLTGLLSHFQSQASVTPEAADLAWEIGQTAGKDNPSVLIARAEYLINAKRWAEIDFLPIRHASLLPEAQLLETAFAALMGDEGRLEKALKARRCSVFEPQYHQFQTSTEPVPCVR